MSSCNSTIIFSVQYDFLPGVRIIMYSGRCKGKGLIGRLLFDCPCHEGIFPVDDQGIVSNTCDLCTHPQRDHENRLSINIEPPHPPAEISVPEPPLAGIIASPLLPTSNYEYDNSGFYERTANVSNNPSICPRENTVNQLIQLVDKYPVVHIRGTPGCGKTTLALLLHNELMRQGNKHVFLLLHWTHLENYNKGGEGDDGWVFFNRMLQEKFSPRPGYCDEECVLIVDEAQVSYADEFFWSDVIKLLCDQTLCQFKVKIYLFCSFGSPLEGVEKSFRYTPHRMVPQQRVTFTAQEDPGAPQVGLFYTPTEFVDVMNRLIRNQYTEDFKLTPDAISYVLSLTNGHPGCVKELMTHVFDSYRRPTKHQVGFEITTKDLMDLVDNHEDDTFTALQRSRSFPTGSQFTVEMANLVSRIAEEGSIQWDVNDEVLRVCYMNGWVHRMYVPLRRQNGKGEEVAILPSRLHEKFIEYLLCFRANLLPERFTHLNQLCVEVLRGFSATNLKYSTLGKNMSTAGKLRPVEAQFQDEFYRVFNKVAGRGVPISSEWSRAGSGRVDFWIPGKKWAVELLRDYGNVDEYVSRFKKGGTYYEWLKEKAVEDWVVINCAAVPPRTGHPEPKLFHAIFQNAYRELRIFDHNAKPFGAAMRLTD